MGVEGFQNCIGHRIETDRGSQRRSTVARKVKTQYMKLLLQYRHLYIPEPMACAERVHENEPR